MNMELITEDARIYATDGEGKVIAEITFPAEDGIATIDHTFVDASLRGQGVAGRLVQAAVDKIIADGHQIAATCSYAHTWLENHPEYRVVDTGDMIACKLGRRR